MGDAVAMTNKDILSVEGVGGTVAGSLEGLLVALDEDVASSVTHIDTLAVEIGTFDTTAATYGHTVVALRALTAIVPRDKEIVPAVVLEDKRASMALGPA